jgi:ERCC4-type nuclease
VGRFWPQIGKLQRSADRAFLLLEGRSLFDGPIRSESVRGIVLAVMELGVRVLRTDGVSDSARWLRRLAIRAQATRPKPIRPAYAQRPRAPIRSSEATLAAVPGVSVKTARALLARFGSIGGMIAAGPSQWQEVPGVGVARRRALMEALLPDGQL